MPGSLPSDPGWVKVWRADGGNGLDLSTECVAPDGTRVTIAVAPDQASVLVNSWMVSAMLRDPGRFLPSPP